MGLSIHFFKNKDFKAKIYLLKNLFLLFKKDNIS